MAELGADLTRPENYQRFSAIRTVGKLLAQPAEAVETVRAALSAARTDSRRDPRHVTGGAR